MTDRAVVLRVLEAALPLRPRRLAVGEKQETTHRDAEAATAKLAFSSRAFSLLFQKDQMHQPGGH